MHEPGNSLLLLPDGSTRTGPSNPTAAPYGAMVQRADAGRPAMRWLCSVVPMLALIAGGWWSGSSARGTTWARSGAQWSGTAQARTNCTATRELMAPRAFPAMVQLLPDHQVGLPGHWNVTGPVPEVEKEFECGAFEGYIVRNALHGKYRRENNAFARRMNYPIRKWPYVPLRGEIVQDEPTSVLEIYEGL